MFTPRLLQDPATGSATAALAGLLAELGSGPEVRLRVGQGGDMGRSSLLAARARRMDSWIRAFVGGRCAARFEGSFVLAGAQACTA